MFENFYQLRQQPFGTNPDPRFLYMSRTHREAYSSLLYRVQTDAGFLAMVAQPGMGKTTLLFHLLHRLQSTTRTAFIFHTQCTSHELLRYLLSEFDCDTSITDPVRISRELKSILLAEAKAGRRCVLIIDEAQNLEPDVLETIRLLSNFETPRHKLLNIILSGQSELGEMLSRPGLQQLRQRLSCIIHIETFAPEETALYIANRLSVAGYSGELSHLFSVQALALIAQLSNGIPRIINNICFNALSLGFALENRYIDLPIVEEVACDLGLSLQPPLAPVGSAESCASSLRSVLDSPSVGKWGDALAAVSSVCTRQKQEQSTPDLLRAPVTIGSPDAQKKHPTLPSAMEGDNPETNGGSPDIRREGALLRPSADVTKSQSAVPARTTEDQNRKQPAAALFTTSVDGGNRLTKTAGLVMARACLCAVLLWIAPAIDGPSRHSVSAEKAVGPVNQGLAPTAKTDRLARKVISSGFETRRYLHSHLPGNPTGASEKVSGHVYEPSGQIRQMWKASHDPGAVANLTTAPSDPKQMMETLPLNSLSPASHVVPDNGVGFALGAEQHPSRALPAHKNRQ